eukprot:gene31469-38864_t
MPPRRRATTVDCGVEARRDSAVINRTPAGALASAEPIAGTLSPAPPRKRRYTHGDCGWEIPADAPVASRVVNAQTDALGRTRKGKVVGHTEPRLTPALRLKRWHLTQAGDQFRPPLQIRCICGTRRAAATREERRAAMRSTRFNKAHSKLYLLLRRNVMVEEWRDVVGFESFFRVSSLGHVFSKRTGKLLRLTPSKTGYLCLNTRIGGRKGVCHSLKVHRMVALAFLAPPSPELVAKCAGEAHGQVVVRHRDNCKTNNEVGNLAWGSTQDNADDFVATEAFAALTDAQSGCGNAGAKASPALVAYIRSRYVKGCRLNGARALAAEQNTSVSSPGLRQAFAAGRNTALAAFLFEVSDVATRRHADPIQHRPPSACTGCTARAGAQHLAVRMTPRHIRDLVMRAAAERNGKTMDLLVAQLVDAARVREILRAKGYGATGMTASATAAQVPTARKAGAVTDVSKSEGPLAVPRCKATRLLLGAGGEMEFAKLPNGQQRAFANVSNSLAEIRNHAVNLVAGLAVRCEEVHNLKRGGFAIAPVDGGGTTLANVTTPFGSGRATLAWKLGDQELVGVIRFEQLCQDAYGKEFHKLVWALAVPMNDPAYSAKGEQGLHMSSSPYEDDQKSAHFQALLSVFAGFAGVDLSISPDR